jgi:hypothetical protein
VSIILLPNEQKNDPMKLTFFLIALALILLRLCYPSMEIWHNGRGHGAMIMRSDNYVQEIDWSGKVRLSDNDRSIAEISPGGYLKFRENDTTLKAASNLQGEISYTLYNGHEQLPLNDSGQQFIAAQIQKMIVFGFFGEERAERIYQKGGVPALLAELSRIRMEGARDPYLNLVFKADSLTAPQLIGLLQVIDSSTNTTEQQHLLSQFGRGRLRDSAVAQEWLSAVGHIGQSYMEKDLLLNYIDTGLTTDRFDTVLAIAGRFGSPNDQQEVYQRLAELPHFRVYDSAVAQPWLYAVGEIGPTYLKKDLLLRFLQTDSNRAGGLPVDQFDTVLAITGRFESPEDSKEIYDDLISLPPSTEAEWGRLVRAVGALGPDYLKSELLLKIAPKMPRNDSLMSSYKMAAKSIQGDMDYGKVMRAME